MSRTFDFTVVFAAVNGHYEATCPAFPDISRTGPTLEVAEKAISGAIQAALEGLLRVGKPVPADAEPATGTGIFREPVTITVAKA